MAVEKGNLVKFHYTASLENGHMFGRTEDKEPVECKVGDGKFIRGVEDGLIGMEVSQKKEVVIPPDQGFGHRKEELIRKESIETLQGRSVKIGQIIELENNNKGEVFHAEVLAIDADIVTLDLNHPLAGKTIRCNLEVLEIA